MCLCVCVYGCVIDTKKTNEHEKPRDNLFQPKRNKSSHNAHQTQAQVLRKHSKRKKSKTHLHKQKDAIETLNEALHQKGNTQH